jgi:hypothetical protein
MAYPMVKTTEAVSRSVPTGRPAQHFQLCNCKNCSLCAARVLCWVLIAMPGSARAMQTVAYGVSTGDRLSGSEMSCGWECSASLTAPQFALHELPKAPGISANPPERIPKPMKRSRQKPAQLQIAASAARRLPSTQPQVCLIGDSSSSPTLLQRSGGRRAWIPALEIALPTGGSLMFTEEASRMKYSMSAEEQVE